jgi:hypothetical protein
LIDVILFGAELMRFNSFPPKRDSGQLLNAFMRTLRSFDFAQDAQDAQDTQDKKSSPAGTIYRLG